MVHFVPGHTETKNMIEYLEDYLKIKENAWIPINERLPEPDTYILVSFSNSFATDIGRYENDEEGGAFYPAYMDRSYSALGFCKCVDATSGTIQGELIWTKKI